MGSRLPEAVRHVIAVASGKGGVGKSTVAVNLALALAAQSKKTGLLDADLFGPSVPRMMNLEGLSDAPRIDPARKLIIPRTNYGVKCMSMGLLKRAQEGAVIWRGLMVMKAIEQLLHQVAWGPLDVLVVDMPPGTGDSQIAVCQNVPLTGAIIVTTPQQVAVSDADKAIDMFTRLKVPILGVVQNMSRFACPSCRHEANIFSPAGSPSGAHQLAAKWKSRVLADIPIDGDVCAASDSGLPLCLTNPAHRVAREFELLAEGIIKLVSEEG